MIRVFGKGTIAGRVLRNNIHEHDMRWGVASLLLLNQSSIPDKLTSVTSLLP